MVWTLSRPLGLKDPPNLPSLGQYRAEQTRSTVLHFLFIYNHHQRTITIIPTRPDPTQYSKKNRNKQNYKIRPRRKINQPPKGNNKKYTRIQENHGLNLWESENRFLFSGLRCTKLRLPARDMQTPELLPEVHGVIQISLKTPQPASTGGPDRPEPPRTQTAPHQIHPNLPSISE